MQSFLIMLYGATLFLLWLEYRIHRRALASFRWIIHVNGIRGKTDVCRRLDGALRANGLRVFTKTTGTRPCYLDVSGQERVIRRWGCANIREQIRMVRQAAREGAEVLIVECMAVRPELQQICQRKIIPSQYTIITNVRHDHLFELGESLSEVAQALCATVPEKGCLFLGTEVGLPIFQQACVQRETELRLWVPPEGASFEEENQGLVDQVCLHLGFQPRRVPHTVDFGAMHWYTFRGQWGQKLYFLNLFSVNDPDSTAKHLEQWRGRKAMVLLFHHRPDRPDRFLLFQRHLFPSFPDHALWVMGRGSQLPLSLLRRGGRQGKACVWQDMMQLEEGTLVVGMGNIKGEGERWVSYLEGSRQDG